MKRFRPLRKSHPYYLIPIMIGMAGVLFSSQLDDSVLRAVVVLMSLGVPLAIGGNLLARVYSDGLQRFLLIAGMATLTIGAVLTVSGLSESLVDSAYVSPEVGYLSKRLGMGSLLLGLLAVLYSTVRSEALIDELGDRFMHVANHMGEGFVLLNASGKVVLLNQPLSEMTGIREHKLIGRPVQDAALENNIDAVLEHTHRRQSGLASQYEMDWNKDGEVLRLLVLESPLFDRRKRRVGTLITVRDVTVEHRLKKRLEDYTQGLQKLVENRTAKLHASEKRYRELLLNMNEGFLTVDKEYKIRFANERVRHALRSDEESLLGRDFFDFVEIKERERLREACALVDSGVPQRKDQEYTFVREDGAYVPVKVSVARVEEEQDDTMYFSLVITDVLELKEMHHELELRARELERANKELRELDRAKDVFLSNVSHELRTPLGTLDGYIEMLESESIGAISGPQKAALEVMARNVDRLSRMINEMIESSRMEIRGIRLAETLFAPAPLLHESADSMHPDALRKDIGMSVYAADDLPFMWGDRDKIGQVTSILLSNAVKFSPRGSSVTVRAEAREGAAMAIVVSDTGIGIPPEHHEQIFRKFYQVDASMTRHYQGTGIGLAIAKSIVEAHGGHIELESAPGKGSTVTVIFPLAAFDAGGGAATPPHPKGHRAYVVAQGAELRGALVEALVKAGCEAEGFDSGHACMRQARDVPPDLVIIDESLSDIAADEAARRLRDEIGAIDLPVVLLRKDPARQDGSAEWADVLPKPFTCDAFLERIETMLDRRLAGDARAAKDA